MSRHSPVHVEILLSKLQAERIQSKESKLTFNFLLSFGWLIFYIWPMQMILLYIFLCLLLRLYLALKSKFLQTSKKECFLLSWVPQLQFFWAPAKYSCELQLAYWVRAYENLGRGLILICGAGERRGWEKLAWLVGECLPSEGKTCLPSRCPGLWHLTCVSSVANQWLAEALCGRCLTSLSYLLEKVRATKHNGSR